MNIIVVVLLAIVMASVDQSYFGAPNCANSVEKQTLSLSSIIKIKNPMIAGAISQDHAILVVQVDPMSC